MASQILALVRSGRFRFPWGQLVGRNRLIAPEFIFVHWREMLNQDQLFAERLCSAAPTMVQHLSSQIRTSITELSEPCGLGRFSRAFGSCSHCPSTTNLY